MLEQLEMAPPDAILGLTEAFRNDPNPKKINLSVGVYQDASGKTPLLDVVKGAERSLFETEQNKSYLPIDGLPEYGRCVRKLIFGAGHSVLDEDRAVTAQTPGGTGALRVAADFLRQKLDCRRIWCSRPTWANHPNVFRAAGLNVESYGYLDEAGTGLDFDAMLEALDKIPAGDSVCLHACCHNPTGVDPTVEQWQIIGDRLEARRIFPLVDFAYQGFGQGLEEDAAGLRTLIASCPELLICSSFSKNFGMYGERVGAVTLLAPSTEQSRIGQSHLKVCIRTNYSNPPKHGGAIVAAVLSDATLRPRWESELQAMRDRIQGMRRLFVETLQGLGVNRDFSFITRQRGMFSFSGLSPEQVDRLRAEYSIYIVRSGRINVAGMTPGNMDRIANAVAAVLDA